VVQFQLLPQENGIGRQMRLVAAAARLIDQIADDYRPWGAGSESVD